VTITIIDVVRAPAKKGDFPGLYSYSLPNRVWTNDSRHMVFDTLWGSQWGVICVDTKTKTLKRLTGAANIHGLASLIVLDVVGNNVLIKESTPISTHQVHLVKLDLKESEGSVMPGSWECVRSGVPIRDDKHRNALADCSFHVASIPLDAKEPSSNALEAIVVFPKTNQPCPLVLRPHGGPHGGVATTYNWEHAMLLLQGFAVAAINYRGSIGFGQDALESLPGNCGRRDVDDCMATLKHVLAMEKDGKKLIDPARVMVWGGSHGGFLTTHLIGQFPDTFKAAAVRNPVTNIVFMATETDIPDWCYVECGIKNFEEGHMPTVEDMVKLFKASPIAYAENIKTPLLIMLGLKDLRVPPSQGINFHRLLKARGKITKCHTYPESTHSLMDSVRTQSDVVINILKWFLQE